ncbi:hypothetical protein GCM10023333_36520 [Ferrimonas pelagia]|uniref:Uncharacterized protein n=1 Tax=Ferrimonas pelagia TaxID=1177826 RepID=A0ABP9FD10_9GAMM
MAQLNSWGSLRVRDIEMPFYSMIVPKTGAECRWVRADRELGGVIFESGWPLLLWENGDSKRVGPSTT